VLRGIILRFILQSCASDFCILGAGGRESKRHERRRVGALKQHIPSLRRQEGLGPIKVCGGQQHNREEGSPIFWDLDDMGWAAHRGKVLGPKPVNVWGVLANGSAPENTTLVKAMLMLTLNC
jgi:hypothetical protein